MYDLVILTTAIIRPEIHIKSFTSLKTFINKSLNIYWIINLDFVNVFSNSKLEINDKIIETSLYNTSITIKYLFKNYSNIKFKFLFNKHGNFNKAVRNLLIEIEQIIDNIKYGILYLEDDWIITKNSNNINYYLKNLEENKNTIIGYRFSFLKCCGNRASFRPSVWSISGFKDIFIKAFKENDTIDADPENILIEFWKKNNNKQFLCLKDELNVIDIGRAWAQQKGIIKWNKVKPKTIEYQII